MSSTHVPRERLRTTKREFCGKRLFAMYQPSVLLGFSSIFLAFLIPPASALAGEGRWTGNGPPGGTVFSIAVDDSSSRIAYVGTDDGVYKTLDGGGNWTRTSEGLPQARVTSLAVAPDNPSTVYAGTLHFPLGSAQYGVFKSVDGGVTWNSANNGLSSLDIFCVAVAPLSPATLLVGTFGPGPVFKSSDGGASWHATAYELSYPFTETAVFRFHPTDPSIVYAAAGTLFKSTDGGDTWSHVGPLVEFDAVAIDSTNPMTLYAGDVGGSGIFKSTDSGTHWAASNEGLPKDTYGFPLPILGLTLAPSDSRNVYVAVYGGGIFKSANGGTTWLQASDGLLNPYVLGLVPTGSSTLYALTNGAGVWSADTSSDFWEPANRGLNESYVGAIAADTNSPNLYAATYGGVFRSADGGNSWVARNTGLPESHIGGIVLDGSRPGTLYVSSLLFGVAKSTDGARTWRSVTNGLSSLAVTALAADSAHPSILYAATLPDTSSDMPAAVFKSVDAGESWSASGFSFGFETVFMLTVDPTNGSVVYAIGTGLFRSTDAGATWSRISNGDSVCFGGQTLSIDRATPTTLYSGTMQGICKSTDGGNTWHSLIYDVLKAVNQVIISSDESHTVFAAMSANFDLDVLGGVLWSRDGGTTWHQLAGSLPNPNVMSLSFDTTGKTIYAGLALGGVVSIDIDSVRLPVATGPQRPSVTRTIQPRKGSRFS